MGNIVFVGAGGTGMSSLAMLLADLWYNNIICIDAVDGPLMEKLRSKSIKEVFVWHGLYAVQKDDIVIYSDIESIVSGPEVSQSREYQKLSTKKHFHICITYNQFITEVSKRFITIAVAWSNGKTSTTGMLIHTFSQLSQSNFWLGIVGGLMLNYNQQWYLINTSIQSDICHLFDHIFNQKHQLDYTLLKKYYFIIEACEYRNHFLLYDVDYAIITNIDRDHTDFFLTRESYRDAFVQFVSRVRYMSIVTPQVLSDIKSSLPWLENHMIVPSGSFDFENDYLIGKYHTSNAAAIVSLLYLLWYNDHNLLTSVFSSRKGMGRRMEYLGDTSNWTKIYSDYSHHAPAIQGNIEALQNKFPDKKLMVVFQPHQAQRVIVGWDDFRQALSWVDRLIIYRLYTAREEFSRLQKDNTLLQWLQNFNELWEKFAQHCWGQYIIDIESVRQTLQSLSSDYMVVFFSAGDLDKEMSNKVAE